MSEARSKWIPEILSERYNNIVALEEARYLLANMPKDDSGIEAEREFVRKKIEDMENDLHRSEKEAAAIIDTISNNHAAWTVARFHFFRGYKWEAAGAKAGLSAEAARMKATRAFEKASKDDPYDGKA